MDGASRNVAGDSSTGIDGIQVLNYVKNSTGTGPVSILELIDEGVLSPSNSTTTKSDLSYGFMMSRIPRRMPPWLQ